LSDFSTPPARNNNVPGTLLRRLNRIRPAFFPLRASVWGKIGMRMRNEVDFLEGGNLGQPDFLDISDVGRVAVVKIIVGLTGELHGESEAEITLGTCLTEHRKVLHPWDLSEDFEASPQKCMFLRAMLRMDQ
jgi:hypothetical protein